MLHSLSALIPTLFNVVFLWFVVAVVICIVKLINANKTIDSDQKKQERRRAWRLILYPVLVFITVAVLQSLLNIAIG